MQHMQIVGPILFVHNENIAHVMPRVTACAMMSCTHCAARTHRQAGHPMYMWCARNYLWPCHLRRLKYIYQKITASHFSTLNMDFANQNVLKRILIAMHNENKADWNENFRICAARTTSVQAVDIIRPVGTELQQKSV